MHFLPPADLLKLSFGSNWVQKTETSIYKIFSNMLFSNMDFDFAHFANFGFAHFILKLKKVLVNLGKITK